MAVYNVTYSSEEQHTQAPSNAIYIDDNPGAGDLLHIKVDCLATGETTLRLLGQSNQVASSDNYHFDVFFRPGELASPGKITVSPAQASTWSIHVDAAPDGTDIYFLYKGSLTLKPGDSFTVTLQNVGAQTKTGPRSTTVNLSWIDDAGYMSPTDLQDLAPTVEIINYTKKQLPPLSVGFETTNTVLNDGSQKNGLALRIVNQSVFDIDLDPTQCKFTLSFDASTDTHQRWALATPNQINALYIPGQLDSSGVDSHWPGYGAWDVEKVSTPLEWTFTPKSNNTALGAGAALEIPISNIVTDHATGRALLHVQYQGLSGYDDGEITVEIEKIPLLFGDTHVAASGNLGIGTTTPSHPMHIQAKNVGVGLSHTYDNVELVTYVDSSSGWLATNSNHPLFFTTNKANDSSAQLTLLTNGKVGIGTSSPRFSLEVCASGKNWGFVHTNGSADGCIELGSYLFDSAAAFGTRSNHPLYLFTNNSDDAQLAITTDGKIGIGTTSPTRPVQLMVQNHGVGFSHQCESVELVTYINSAGGWLGTMTKHPLYLMTNDNDYQVTLLTNNNVGINTKTPAESLHVSGNLRVDGEFKINGQRPMEMTIYTASSDYPNFKTDYDFDTWAAVIAGFDGYGDSSCHGLKVLPEKANDNSNKWVISCDVRGLSDKSWQVFVLFIRRELVNVNGYIEQA